MNEFYGNEENEAGNNSMHHNQSVESGRGSQLSKPNLGQKSKPSFAKVTSKPNFGFSKKI